MFGLDYVNSVLQERFIENNAVPEAPAAQPQESRVNQILSQPGMSNALLSLGGSMMQAAAEGQRTGAGIGMGLQNFGATLEKAKQQELMNKLAERQMAQTERQLGQNDRRLDIAETKATTPQATALQKDYEFLLQQGYSPDQAIGVLKKGTSVNVNTGAETVNAGEVKASEAFGTDVGERATKRIQAAQEAQNQLYDMERMELAIARGAETGFGQESMASLKSMAAGMFDIEFDDSLGEQEIIRQITNKAALRIRNPESGMGLPGSASNRDVIFLKSSVPGLMNSTEGNAKIIEMSRRMSKLQQDVAAEQSRIVQANGGVIPMDLDTQLMKFVNTQQILTPEERQEIEMLSKQRVGTQSPATRIRIDLDGNLLQ